MSLAVVRCPGCRGESRVAVDSLGHMVGCPRCQVPFVAEEEVPVVQPVARPSAPRPSASRGAPVVPVAPRRRPSPEPEPEPELPTPTDSKPEIPDPEHDPHLPPPAGLPVSVLVGLALLPFAIPPLWLLGPLLTGQETALSLAVPISLAIAASALCLGVVYTIDWTATTRIKGVLMLLGLAYLSAAGLYFLKKDMMDRVRGWGGRTIPWAQVQSKEGNFKVSMPAPAAKTNEQPLPKVSMSGGWSANYASDVQDQYTYLATSGRPDKDLAKADDEWFDAVGKHFADAGGAKIVESRACLYHDHPGREWRLQLNEDKYRVVQVYVINGRVYYLSVEGPNVASEDDAVHPFFQSFDLVNTKR